MHEDLVVAARFCGPPGIANGGYVAGLLARGISGPAEVTLRAPTPLDTRVKLELGADGSRSLQLAGTELARATPASLELELRAAPDPLETEARAGGCRAMRTHPFPACFVCGPARADGDGLRVFPGMVAESDAVAALWTPDASLCDARGRVAPEFLWAVLDCPSAFPLLESEAARALEPMVLAKLCVALDGELRAGERARVVAWPIAQEGKRGTAGAAIFSEAGAVVGRARATWVSLAGRR
jgi:hypothetical protein